MAWQISNHDMYVYNITRPLHGGQTEYILTWEELHLHDRPCLRAGDDVMEHGQPVQSQRAEEALPRPGCACLPGVQRLWQAPPKIWAFLGTVLQTHTQAYHA